MSTDTLHDFGVVAWNLRHVLVFVAFLTSLGVAADFWHLLQQERGRVGVLEEQLAIAGKREADLIRLATQPPVAAVDVPVDDDPLFSEGYVYDRIPSWVPADVPGARGGAR